MKRFLVEHIQFPYACEGTIGDEEVTFSSITECNSIDEEVEKRLPGLKNKYTEVEKPNPYQRRIWLITKGKKIAHKIIQITEGEYIQKTYWKGSDSISVPEFRCKDSEGKIDDY